MKTTRRPARGCPEPETRNLRVAAILQARMGSIRLPGKCMADIVGHPLLFHVVERLKRIKGVDDIVIATSTLEEDKIILEKAAAWGVSSFAGSADDVLARYVEAARGIGASIIIRATGDNPLFCPESLSHALARHIKKEADYTFMEDFPLGTGFSCVAMKALLRIHNILDELHYHREHVTSFIHAQPEDFRIEKLQAPPCLRRPELRLTVDTEEDLSLMREIYKRLYRPGEIIDLKEVIKLLDAEPELALINAHIRQKKPENKDADRLQG
ncbi:MAG: glycosyltransferase family protein [bacterium]